MSLNKQKIFVALDCILDTRLGTIARLNDDAASVALASGYHSREEDKFEGIDMAAYEELYKARDVETLKVSTITSCLPLLNHICKMLTDELISKPLYSGIEVVVNLYPYQLDEELQNLFALSIQSWLGPDITVSLVNLSNDFISPAYFQNSFSTIIMYHYKDWLNRYLESMEKINLHEVVLFVPALYFEEKPHTTQMEELLKEAPHPFVALETLVKPAIDLSIIDVKYFSIFDPADIQEFDNIMPDFRDQTSS